MESARWVRKESFPGRGNSMCKSWDTEEDKESRVAEQR